MLLGGGPRSLSVAGNPGHTRALVVLFIIFIVGVGCWIIQQDSFEEQCLSEGGKVVYELGRRGRPSCEIAQEAS